MKKHDFFLLWSFLKSWASQGALPLFPLAFQHLCWCLCISPSFVLQIARFVPWGSVPSCFHLWMCFLIHGDLCQRRRLCSLTWCYFHLSPGTQSPLCWLSFCFVQLRLLLTILALEVFLVISSKNPFIACSLYPFLVPSCMFPMACTAWFVPQIFTYSLKCHFCPVLRNRLTASVRFWVCTFFCSWWWCSCPSCILWFRSLPARNWQRSLALILCYADQRHAN